MQIANCQKGVLATQKKPKLSTAKFELRARNLSIPGSGASLRNDNKISDNKTRKFSKFDCHEFRKKNVLGQFYLDFDPSPTPSKTEILLILSFRRLYGLKEIV